MKKKKKTNTFLNCRYPKKGPLSINAFLSKK
jgi:hypothetical protein